MNTLPAETSVALTLAFCALASAAAGPHTQNFAFSTRTSIITNFSTLGEAVTSEDDTSFVHVPIEVRADEIVEALSSNLPVRVDQYNSTIVRADAVSRQRAPVDSDECCRSCQSSHGSLSDTRLSVCLYAYALTGRSPTSPASSRPRCATTARRSRSSRSCSTANRSRPTGDRASPPAPRRALSTATSSSRASATVCVCVCG